MASTRARQSVFGFPSQYLGGCLLSLSTDTPIIRTPMIDRRTPEIQVHPGNDALNRFLDSLRPFGPPLARNDTFIVIPTERVMSPLFMSSRPRAGTARAEGSVGLAPLVRNDKELFTNTVVAVSHCLNRCMRRCPDLTQRQVETIKSLSNSNSLRTLESILSHKMPRAANMSQNSVSPASVPDPN